MKKLVKMLILLGASATVGTSAHAAEIFFADTAGRVGSYNTVTSTQRVVGDLSAFAIGQIVGLAYDSSNSLLYMLDRNAAKVYTMNSITGAASFALQSSNGFQGGAYKNGTLYGMSENNGTLEGFTTTGTPLALSGTYIGHVHNLGVNASSGQLFYANGNQIFNISDNGTSGALVKTVQGTSWIEDVDYLAGDYAYVDCSSSVKSANGSVIVNTGMGCLAGVAVAQSSVSSAVPEPATWAMMIGGFGMVGGAMRSARRKHRVTVSYA